MVNIYIQGQLIEQYADEAIEITSSVLDVGDLTKNTGDFSKTFTVPASPSNNKYFQHWYNASIDDGFDARTKVEGSIDIDGVPFRTGKWRLSEAIFKNGTIDGYVINFFGNLPNIKDTIGDDLLSDINFDDYDHEWSGDSVRDGLKGQLGSVFHTNRKIVYTPMSSKRYFYNSDSSVGDAVNSINIASTSTAGAGINWQDLRPSMKAKAIVDSIQNKYGTGTKQVTKLRVVNRPTANGTIMVTLNGVENGFSINPLYATAGLAAQFINLRIAAEFSGQVTTSVSGDTVTITSVDEEQEETPSFQIADAGSLELEMSVDTVGAFAYENPIVFSDDFFQTSEFEQIYLWLNNGETNDIGLSTVVAPWNSGDLTNIDPITNVITVNASKTGFQQQDFYKVKVTTSDVVGYENIPFTLTASWTRTDSDGTVVEGGNTIEAVADEDGNVPNVTIPLRLDSPPEMVSGTSTYKLQYSIETNTELKITLTMDRERWVQTTGDALPVKQSTITSFSTTEEVVAPKVSISSIMPEIKIVDFLKGIFDMFKLVVVPQQDGSMLVNTLDSFYDQGNRYDISDRVDYSTYKVKRGELYQSISYKFEDPSTILNEEFQNRARDRQSYGSSLVNVYESVRPIKLIDGEKVQISIPFEQVIYDRLRDPHTSGGLSNISTGTIADKDLQPVNPKPILHYVSEQDISGCPIKFIGSNNIQYTLNNKMIMPMNQLGTLDPTFSLLFESEVSCWDGSTLSSNLYTLHHSEYIEAVFRLKRRSFEYEALLPTQLITRLGLNDILSVKGIDYRINKFKHNLLTGITKLDLINGFDKISGASLTANKYTPSFYIPRSVNMNRHSFTLYFNVPRAASDYTVSIVDTGEGSSFLTSAYYGSNDNMMFIRTGSDNTGELSRSCNVVYTNTVTGEVNTVTVTQLGDE